MTCSTGGWNGGILREVKSSSGSRGFISKEEPRLQNDSTRKMFPMSHTGKTYKGVL